MPVSFFRARPKSKSALLHCLPGEGVSARPKTRIFVPRRVAESDIPERVPETLLILSPVYQSAYASD